MLCFTISGQNSIYEWVRDHRVHHKFSETDADPHNSNRGFFFAHVGWLMLHKHPEVVRKGKMLDLSDIMEDPVVRFHQKWVVCFLLLIKTLKLSRFEDDNTDRSSLGDKHTKTQEEK